MDGAELDRLFDASKLPASRKEAIATGSTRYFTGVPCKRGHVAVRTVNNGCSICLCVVARERYAKDIEASREKSRQNARKWVAANRQKLNEKKRSLRALDPEAWREKERRSREPRLEVIREQNKRRVLAWRAANPDGHAIHNRNRRARSKKAEGSHTAEDIKRIREMQRDKCASCGARLRGGGHVDHIIALSKGGSNWPRNLQIMCETCNVKKWALDPVDFMRRQGRLL